jgi:Flp pilus assembly protein TadG
MVEFAVVLPLLLLVVLGIVQFGMLFNNYITLTDAVRTAARQAAVSRELPDPEAAIDARWTQATADLDESKLDYTVDSPTWSQGDDVTVTGQYDYSINILGLVLKSGTLTSKTTERLS